MLELIALGCWASFLIGYRMTKKNSKKKAKKIVYYDYSRFAVKYKRINNNLNEQTKGF